MMYYVFDAKAWGLGSKVLLYGFRVWGLRHGLQGLGFKGSGGLQISGFRVSGLWGFLGV